ncbi:MAG TPA: hypothetical protein DD376_01085 [Sutterella sp.]|nr:hypothetical protein [Sutterella sp.]
MALAFAMCTFFYLMSDGFYAVERFHSIGNNVQGHLGVAEWLRRMVFIAEYMLAVCLFLSAALTRSPVNVILLCVFWGLLTLELVAQSVYGRPADIENIAMLNAAAGNIADALVLYKSFIASSSLKAALVFVPALFLFLFFRKTWWVRRAALFVFVGAVTGLISFYLVILLCRGSPALIGFPKGLSYAFASAVIKANSVLTPTEKLALSESSVPALIGKPIRNVLVVVDESIEYSVFAKLLEKNIPGVTDFGQSYSGANCSAPSNYVLRRAWWRRQASNHVDIKEVPSLFQIAREAGYQTVYMDNQNVLKDGAVRNYIDAEEAQFMDSVYETTGPGYERDMKALKQIADILKKPGKHFIFVNKIGSHFPYEHTLVPSSVTNNRIENYWRSVRQNATDFIFNLSALAREDSVFFYTSDHGQNLNGFASHCNTGNEIATKEYTVPFLILTQNSEINRRLVNARLSLYGKLTHLEFSESVRNLLGKEVPGSNSVFNYVKPKTPFCGMYGQPIRFLGVAPSCKKLD